VGQPEGKPVCQPHEYIRGGTAKLLTLFRPATGDVRAKGVTNATNVVLHPWLQNELLQILANLPDAPVEESERPIPAQWATWVGTYATLAIAATPTDSYLGQPGWPLDDIDGDLVVPSRGDAAIHTAERIVVEHGRAQANAKLVFRTVLTIDGPEGARHYIPLQRRKSVNPLIRRTGVSN